MAAILDRPIYPGDISRYEHGLGPYEISSKPHQTPLEIRAGSIVIDPNAMTPGEFYFATLDGIPYLYQKNAEGEIEVYGLADY